MNTDLFSTSLRAGGVAVQGVKRLKKTGLLRFARKDGLFIRSCLLFLACTLLSNILHADAIYPFEKPKQQAQFRGLLRDLRCLVCQNQDLADSNAGLAKDLRDEVYAHVQAGESDDEIIRYLTMRYGDFILFKPPVKVVTSMLWFGPFLFLAVGLGLFLRKTRHA